MPCDPANDKVGVQDEICLPVQHFPHCAAVVEILILVVDWFASRILFQRAVVR